MFHKRELYGRLVRAHGQHSCMSNTFRRSLDLDERDRSIIHTVSTVLLYYWAPFVGL